MAAAAWAVTAAAGVVAVLYLLWHAAHVVATGLVEGLFEGLLETDDTADRFTAKLKPTPLLTPFLAPWQSLQRRLADASGGWPALREALHAVGEDLVYAAGFFGLHVHIDAAEGSSDTALRLAQAATRRVSEVLEYFVPMRLEMVAFRRLRFRLRLLDLLLGRPGSVRLHVYGLRIRLRATRHQDWSASQYVGWIQQWHQFHADLAWKLLRGVDPLRKRGWVRKVTGFLLDNAIDGHGFWVTDLHIVIQIPKPNPVPTDRDVPDLTFGVVADDFVFANAELVPLCRDPTALSRAARTARDTEDLRSESRDRVIRDAEVPPTDKYDTTEGCRRRYRHYFPYTTDFSDTLNLAAHRVAGFQVGIYLDCHVDTPFQPCAYFWTMRSFSLQLELPSIFRTWGTSGARGPAYSPLLAVVFCPMSAHAAQGKRLRVAGAVWDMTLNVREPQLNAFLYEALKAVGVWERSAY
eukprot:scaffold8192_cov267-Pinguiococcus_pyrenoidosus.AAC.1